MSEQEKQWWEDGYEAMGSFMDNKRPEFAGRTEEKDKPGFGLWAPDTFYVPQAKPGEKRAEKNFIFVADAPFLSRYHLGEVPNARLQSGREWKSFTCGSKGNFYAPEVYEELKRFIGIDKIPGKFAPCCGEIFCGTSRSGLPMVGHPQNMVSYTVVDAAPYTTKKGETYNFVLKLYCCKSDDAVNKIAVLRELNGELTGCCYKAIRFHSKTSSPQGEVINLVQKGNLDELFPVVMYSGKLLSELFDRARAEPAFREALGKIFHLPVNAKGELLNKIPTFNYQQVLKPLPLEELRALFPRKAKTAPTDTTSAAPKAAKTPTPSIPGFSSLSASSPEIADDDDFPM